MPKFYFQIYKNGNLIRPDLRGRELPQPQAVHEECSKLIQGVLQETAGQTELPDGREFRVVDELRQTVLVAPFVPSSDVAKPPKHPGSVDLHVGLKIRDRRKELRLSQTDLGREVGVSFQQLQKYENGKNRVGASRLAAIAKALNVPVAYFFPVDETQKATKVDIAAQIVDLQIRLRFVQDGLERLRKLLLA